MHSLSLARRTVVATVAAITAAAIVVVSLLAYPNDAPAGVNLNNIQCWGHVSRGTKAPDDPDATQVKYVFSCNGPITGYQIQPNIEVQSMETEVFGTDPVSNVVFPQDSFSCSGDTPGYGVNCVGNAGWTDNAKQIPREGVTPYKIKGLFTIDAPLCAEPRVDPLLTVVTATKNASGVPVQAMSGPFDLGRPIRSGCKPTKFSGKTRIPKNTDTNAEDTDIG